MQYISTTRGVYEEVPFCLWFMYMLNYNFIGDEDADDRWLLLLLEVICLVHFFPYITYIVYSLHIRTHNIDRSVECYNFAMWKIFLRFIDACGVGMFAWMSSKYKSIISIASKALTAASWVHRLSIKSTRLYVFIGWNVYKFYWQIHFWYKIGNMRVALFLWKHFLWRPTI